MYVTCMFLDVLMLCKDVKMFWCVLDKLKWIKSREKLLVAGLCVIGEIWVVPKWVHKLCIVHFDLL